MLLFPSYQKWIFLFAILLGFAGAATEESPEKPVISESKDDNIKELIAEPKPSTTTVGYRQSCIVTFQVFTNEDINAFKTTHIATVNTINECAYICYQNSCSGAIFVPADGEGKEKKAQCKVQMREKEMCNGRLQRHYSFTHDKAVVLSCFRCQPDKPITVSPNAEIIRATTTPKPELVKDRLTTIAPETEKEPEKAGSKPAETGKEPEKQAPTSPEASNKVEDTPKETKPETTTTTDSESEPSDTSVEQSIVNHPETHDKTVTEKPSESNEDTPKPETSEEAKSAEATTSTPSKESPGKVITSGKVTSGPVDFGGCLITFQADYLAARPKEFKSDFELNLHVESPEICATRCYQDGCTGALYFNNGTCVLGYGDKHHCNKRPLINFLDLKNAKKGESIWIHCTSCRSGKYGATGSVTGNMENNKIEMGEELEHGKGAAEGTKAPEAGVAAKSGEEKPEATEKPKEETTKAPEATTVAASKAPETEKPVEETTKAPETEVTKATEAEKPTEGTTKAAETEATKAVATENPSEAPTKAPEAPNTTPEKAVDASKATKKPAETQPPSAQPTEAPTKAPSKTSDVEEELEAPCLITFQAGDLSARPKEFTSEFELNLHTETPEVCAKRCYQDGCTGALFFPKNGTCVLGYGDRQYCDKSPILRFYKETGKEHKESVWIHCTVCRSEKKHKETFEPVAEEKLQSTSN